MKKLKTLWHNDEIIIEWRFFQNIYIYRIAGLSNKYYCVDFYFDFSKIFE